MDKLEQQEYFSEHLLEWYLVNKRDLPWRRSRNAYHIWVSEIMLQQTRVDTVIPYFYRFIEKFPTIDALADAPEEEVLKAWEGLGYYSRARNLQSAVREVRETYGGRVPDNKEDISSLRGVGPYTSGAILSIAYNVPEPAVDGNVMRVLSRYFEIEDDIAKPATRVRMEALAKALIPEGHAGNFNQALMELGATVCTPKSPGCLTCPVMQHCSGRLAGKETALPVKSKAKPPKPEKRVVALIEGSGSRSGQVLIRQRPSEGLLARMWELPHFLADGSAESDRMEPTRHVDHVAQLSPQQISLKKAAFAEGLPLQPVEWFLQAEHTFSHIRWDMNVYRCRLSETEGSKPLSQSFRWINEEDMRLYAFPNVFLRILGEAVSRGVLR